MIKIISFIDRCINKVKLMYRKRLLHELTGNDVSTTKILGEINIVNKNIVFGKHVTFFNGVTIFGDGYVHIGDNVSIGENTIIYASLKNGGISIGSNVQIAAQSYIIDTDHGIKAGNLIKEQENISEPIVIEDDVWIAAGVKVLRGTILKHGCVIGA